MINIIYNMNEKIHFKDNEILHFKNKEKKAFAKFQDTLQDAYYWVYSLTDDLEGDLKYLFGNLPDHYHVISFLDIIDVKYDSDGVIFSNPKWVNCLGQKIVYKVYAMHLPHKRIEIFATFMGASGNIPGLVKNQVDEALQSFMKDLEKSTIDFNTKFKELKTIRGKKEFGMDLTDNNYWQTTKHKGD